MPKVDIDAIAEASTTGYPPPFDALVRGRHRRRLAAATGLTQFGVNLCRLAPGSASSQRHWHEREDEFVYVLDGEVELVEDGGATTLRAGDAAAFKAGVEAQLRERLVLCARCYEQHLGLHPETQGKLGATFIIDKLGNVLELRGAGELTDPTLSACVVSAAIPESFSGLNADLG